jgi:pimeloyl-ACP methyl ester carboxylesterase
MALFILVPGAWHGAWCWERVIPLLEAEGHRVLAPELVGMGADRARAAVASLAVWTDQIAELVAAQEEPVYLAGHSRGGTIISQVAERLPDRIASLIYIAAMLLPDGSSIPEALSDVADRATVEIEPAEDGTCTIAPYEARPVFYTTTAPEWADRAVAQLGPEPMAGLAAPIRVTEASFGRVPRAYIECLQDLAVPLDLQRRMQATWPCKPVIPLDCDHSPFYSEPDALAEALMRVVRPA